MVTSDDAGLVVGVVFVVVVTVVVFVIGMVEVVIVVVFAVRVIGVEMFEVMVVLGASNCKLGSSEDIDEDVSGLDFLDRSSTMWKKQWFCTV